MAKTDRVRLHCGGLDRHSSLFRRLPGSSSSGAPQRLHCAVQASRWHLGGREVCRAELENQRDQLEVRLSVVVAGSPAIAAGLHPSTGIMSIPKACASSGHPRRAHTTLEAHHRAHCRRAIFHVVLRTRLRQTPNSACPGAPLGLSCVQWDCSSRSTCRPNDIKSPTDFLPPARSTADTPPGCRCISAGRDPAFQLPYDPNVAPYSNAKDVKDNWRFSTRLLRR